MLREDAILALFCAVLLWVLMHGGAALWLGVVLLVPLGVLVFRQGVQQRRGFWRCNLLALGATALLNLPYEALVVHHHWAFYPLNCWQQMIFAWLVLLLVQGVVRFFAMIFRGE